MNKKNRDKIFKIILIINFVFVIMISTFVVADVGNFNTYDSGSSSSSSGWSSSSSSGSSSHSSGGGSFGIAGVILTIIIIFFIIKDKLNIQLPGTSGFSINNTNAIADKIRQTDPNFSEEKFLMWTKDLFVKLQAAWTARDFEAIRVFETPDLFEQHSTQLKEYLKQNRINVVERVSVSYAALIDYQNDGSKETITIKLNAKMKDYIIDSNTNELLEGNKQTYWDRSYRMKFVRTSGKQTPGANSETQTTNCPNCGAPTKITSAGKCEYCGSVIVTDDHDWVLSSLESIN